MAVIKWVKAWCFFRLREIHLDRWLLALFKPYFFWMATPFILNLLLRTLIEENLLIINIRMETNISETVFCKWLQPFDYWYVTFFNSVCFLKQWTTFHTHSLLFVKSLYELRISFTFYQSVNSAIVKICNENRFMNDVCFSTEVLHVRVLCNVVGTWPSRCSLVLDSWWLRNLITLSFLKFIVEVISFNDDFFLFCFCFLYEKAALFLWNVLVCFLLNCRLYTFINCHLPFGMIIPLVQYLNGRSIRITTRISLFD